MFFQEGKIKKNCFFAESDDGTGKWTHEPRPAQRGGGSGGTRGPGTGLFFEEEAGELEFRNELVFFVPDFDIHYAGSSALADLPSDSAQGIARTGTDEGNRRAHGDALVAVGVRRARKRHVRQRDHGAALHGVHRVVGVFGHGHHGFRVTGLHDLQRHMVRLAEGVVFVDECFGPVA